jgi:hypothetical protein
MLLCEVYRQNRLEQKTNICLSKPMPFEPVTLGLKFAVRVRHLTARDVLVFTYPACHKAILKQRERIKRKNFETRRLHHRQRAA